MGHKLFALDQNFPEPLVAGVADYVQSAELVPLRQIDERLADADDWEILVALHQHERAWDGLITNDDSMLALEAEICMLVKTKLSLVVAEGQGHNPVRAGPHRSHLPAHDGRQAPAVASARLTERGRRPLAISSAGRREAERYAARDATAQSVSGLSVRVERDAVRPAR